MEGRLRAWGDVCAGKRDLCEHQHGSIFILIACRIMVKILLLTQEGCSPCKRIKRILEESRNEIPGLEIREVRFSSEDGMRLSVSHNILYPPAVFMDGELFAKGKIGEEELKQALRVAARSNARVGS